MALFSGLFKRPFTTSGDYWTRRYASGKTSGAGSYGRFAEYKAEFINRFVAENHVGRVIEFGSGDGNQASLFDFPEFTGVDLVPQVVEAARKRFADRPGWEFMTVAEDAARGGRADMAQSLDVIYHLVEDEVFEGYMRRLADAAGRFLLVYSSDHDEAETGNAHVRHRRYSDWLAANAPELKPARSWENPFARTPESDPKETTFAFFSLFQREGTA